MTRNNVGRAGSVALAAAASALTGCAGDGAGLKTASQFGDVEVVAKDIRFAQTIYSATPGTIRIRYVNDGSIIHTLVIEQVKGFRLKVRSHGDTDEAAIHLTDGRYVIFCDMAGHRAAGMQARLEVH